MNIKEMKFIDKKILVRYEEHLKSYRAITLALDEELGDSEFPFPFHHLLSRVVEDLRFRIFPAMPSNSMWVTIGESRWRKTSEGDIEISTPLRGQLVFSSEFKGKRIFDLSMFQHPENWGIDPKGFRTNELKTVRLEPVRMKNALELEKDLFLIGNDVFYRKSSFLRDFYQVGVVGVLKKDGLTAEKVDSTIDSKYTAVIKQLLREVWLQGELRVMNYKNNSLSICKVSPRTITVTLNGNHLVSYTFASEGIAAPILTTIGYGIMATLSSLPPSQNGKMMSIRRRDMVVKYLELIGQ